VLSALDLARLYLGSCYDLDDRGRLARLREPEDEPHAYPRFALVRTAEGNVALIGAGVPDALAGHLLALAAEEAPFSDRPESPPLRRADYIEALDRHAPLVREYAGPAFVLPANIQPAGGAVRITAGNADLLERHFAWARPRLTDRLPIWVAVEDDVAVSICHCARLPAAGIEAGVETIEACRQRGYGTRVVAAWAHELASRGIVPLYSTSWDNAASRRITARLGGHMYAVTFSLY
jgi:hypothetical protein